MTYTEFYVQTTASNLNAGSTTNDLATYTGVGDSDGTSVFTPSDGSTPANSVSAGDFVSIYVTAGATVATCVARVQSVAAGINGAITVVTATISGAFPAASGGAHTITCKAGGAWKGPNAAVGFPFNFITAVTTDSAGDYVRVNFKGGTTYSITAAMTQTKTGPLYFQGYTSSPGDLGKVTIDGGTSGASYVLLTISGVQTVLRDMIFQNNGASTNNSGVAANIAQTVIERCIFNSVRAMGLAVGAACEVIECEAYSCNQNGSAGQAGFRASSAGAIFDRCISHDNSAAGSCGFTVITNGCTLINCIADTNITAGFNFSSNSQGTNLLVGCVAYNNTTAGILISANNNTVVAENCIFSSNHTFGINNSGTGNVIRLINNGYFSNTSGKTSGVVDETGAITLSGDPFTSAVNADFSLNNTAGAGAACRGTGRGTFPKENAHSGTTVGFPDIGAAQAPIGGGGSIFTSSIIQGLGAI